MDMKTRLAYLGVILIWSTTPLAIKWSSEGVSYLIALTSRMTLGLIGIGVILIILKQRLSLERQALRTYIASGISMYLSMMGVYWASQYIPSGWVSVIFGFSPIMTGLMAALILKEDAVTPVKLFGMVLGVIGLIIIFGNGYSSDMKLFAGIMVVLGSTLVHSLSSVLIKSFNARLTGFTSSAGGLLVAVPLFAITCLYNGQSLPDELSARALGCILYLGIIASTFGFALYYYVLMRMDVGRVSLITLITPVSALILGNILNNEPVSASIVIGAGCITVGLIAYMFGQRLLHLFLDRDAMGH